MITVSESFFEFLDNSRSRVSRLLYKAIAYNRFPKLYPFWKAYRLFITDKEINYITFRTDGTISYLPNGKEHFVNADGTWKRDGRQNGKPARVIMKLFTENGLRCIPSKEFELFANEYKAMYSDEGLKFELKPNTEIADVYCMARHDRCSLGNSCMNNDRDLLDIYTHCKQLSILALIDSGGVLCGRALVWKVSDTLTIMDRIYVCADHLYQSFLEYARQAGWYHKLEYDGYDRKTEFVSPDGQVSSMRLKIYTDCVWDKYPYIDTFTYCDDDVLTNDEDSQHAVHTCNQTDGSREDDVEEDDDFDSDDRYVYSPIYRRDIEIEYATCLTGGRYAGDWCINDDVVWPQNSHYSFYENDSDLVIIDDEYYDSTQNDVIRIDGTWYTTEDVETCCFSGLLRPICEMVYSHHYDGYLIIEYAVQVNGDWYSKTDPDIIEINGVYFLRSLLYKKPLSMVSRLKATV